MDLKENFFKTYLWYQLLMFRKRWKYSQIPKDPIKIVKTAYYMLGIVCIQHTLDHDYMYNTFIWSNGHRRIYKVRGEVLQDLLYEASKMPGVEHKFFQEKFGFTMDGVFASAYVKIAIDFPHKYEVAPATREETEQLKTGGLKLDARTTVCYE